MADESLREVQRRFQTSGSEHDEVAVLTAMIRADLPLDWGSYQRLGTLAPEVAGAFLATRVAETDLALAAHFEHKPAALVHVPSLPTFGNAFWRHRLGTESWPVWVWSTQKGRHEAIGARVLTGLGLLAVSRARMWLGTDLPSGTWAHLRRYPCEAAPSLANSVKDFRIELLTQAARSEDATGSLALQEFCHIASEVIGGRSSALAIDSLLETSAHDGAWGETLSAVNAEILPWVLGSCLRAVNPRGAQ